MPTVDISQKTIAALKSQLAPGMKRIELTDRRGRGLVLRAGAQGLTWQHRCERLGKTHRLSLGAVDRWSITEARQIAEAATDHVRTFGTPPDEHWLLGYLVENGKLAAPAEDEAAALAGVPTFAIGRQEYLEDLLRRNRQATHATYRGFLQMPEVRALDDRPLPSITRDEIVEIINAVHASGRESTAENLTRTIRPMFNWLGGDGRRRRYGVAAGLLVGIKAPDRTLDEGIDNNGEDIETDDDKYVPSIDELARIIAIARSGALQPIVGCAVELACWTVQRRRAVTGARMADFFAIDRELEDGSIDISEGLWRIPPASRKSRTKSGAKKRPHVIPLPAPAWACVTRAAELAHKRMPDTHWLFPGARPRRFGDAVKSMHPSTLTHAFLDLPDCGASPHSVRNTIATDGPALLGLTIDEAGLILDHEHAVKQTEKVLSRTAATGGDSVTGIHYSFYDGTNATWPVMRAWCAALEAAVETAVAELEPLDEIMRKLGDRSYRIGAPTTAAVEQPVAEPVGVALRPLRKPDHVDA